MSNHFEKSMFMLYVGSQLTLSLISRCCHTRPMVFDYVVPSQTIAVLLSLRAHNVNKSLVMRAENHLVHVAIFTGSP